MVAQVQTRNMTHTVDNNKASSMFIKKSDLKKIEVVKPRDVPAVKIKVASKKWEPKMVEVTKVLVVQNIDPTRVEEKVSKILVTNANKYQNITSTSNKQKEKQGMNIF